MMRLLVMSQAFRQDARATPALIEFDPENKLLARAPRLRLEAEALRDQALAVSGLLVPEIGGPPTRPYQPENLWEPVAFAGSNTQFYRQDHGPSLYRRSLYTFVKRTAPAPSLSTFDAPSREASCLRRERTNTPLQALALMNDVQHIEAARVFAEQLLARAQNDEARLAEGFRRVTSRHPSADEQGSLQRALARQRAHFAARVEAAQELARVGESKSTGVASPTEIAAWTVIANLLLNLDEALTR
jgi:hypothetical protein